MKKYLYLMSFLVMTTLITSCREYSEDSMFSYETDRFIQGVIVVAIILWGISEIWGNSNKHK